MGEYPPHLLGLTNTPTHPPYTGTTTTTNTPTTTPTPTPTPTPPINLQQARRLQHSSSRDYDCLHTPCKACSSWCKR
jgi:hypothetical protein